MKRCENCFENNSDGATNCVICGEPLAVPQLNDEIPAMESKDADSSESSDSTMTGSTPIGTTFDNEAAEAAEAFEGSDIAVAIEEFAKENGEISDEVVDEAAPAVMLLDDDWADDSADSRIFAESAMTSSKVFPADSDIVGETEDVPEASDGGSSDSTMVDGMGTTGVATAGALGTIVLQIYHDDEPRVVHTYPIVHDITLIGREDPQRDIFPDLDLGPLSKEGVSVGHVSRQHLRLLRDGQKYYLFVYKGSTGTQVCKSLVDPSQYGKRFEIEIGDRIILGGKVRMKLAQG